MGGGEKEMDPEEKARYQRRENWYERNGKFGNSVTNQGGYYNKTPDSGGYQNFGDYNGEKANPRTGSYAHHFENNRSGYTGDRSQAYGRDSRSSYHGSSSRDSHHGSSRDSRDSRGYGSSSSGRRDDRGYYGSGGSGGYSSY